MNKTTNNLKKIAIYTDGSCKPTNPGPAGYGLVVLENDESIYKFSEYIGEATNNIAELKAIETSLAYLSENSLNWEIITIYTDSQYAIGLFTKNWKPKLNKKLVYDIKKQLELFPNLKFEWVKSHNGNFYNEMVDVMAKEAVDAGS